MPILVRNVRLGLDEPEEQLLPQVARRLGVPQAAIRSHAIVARSVDARRKDIFFTYHVEVALDEPPARERERLRTVRGGSAVWIEAPDDSTPLSGTTPLPERPIVIGFGPAGMFAALRLAQLGYRPLVFERGRDVQRRHADVIQRFFREGDFDPSSNLLYGEGGAGTYSDGKLYTRVSDPLCRYVLEVFYHNGGEPDLLINTRPHIGSDRLPTICANIRERITSYGGEIAFESTLDDVRFAGGKLEAVRLSGPAFKDGGTWLAAGPVIVAIGHSARDTVAMLAAGGVKLDPKPFQIGVRIEHPQAMVDKCQYGHAAGHNRLGPAEYHLVAKGAAADQGDIFSFCMCPGGMILPANESRGLVATNGASRAARSGPFANSGLVMTVDPAVLGLDALGGIAYQRQWEVRAFEATGSTYRVPAQRACDFLAGRGSDGKLEISYPLGGEWCDVRSLIPDYLTQALERALPMFEGKFPGFAGEDAIITAPETRASSPFRIVRDKETRQAVDAAGLYPVGEGAGYAGGIVSAAVDGIKAADQIVRHYAPSQ